MSDMNGVAPFAIRDALLRKDFASFLAKSFATVDPGADYIHNWHLDVIADYLERVARGEIKRLIINMPPRNLKSMTVSVAWPAWLLGRRPSLRVMAASYSSELAVRHSLDCRHVMNSGWYQQIFPSSVLVKGQNEKHRFTTTEKGFRFATSVGGTATGEGGDVLIVDDPHTPMQAASNVQRQKANLWFDQTFMSRLNHKKKGAVVVVMQRLHADDLTGHLMQKKQSRWKLLALPAIASEKQIFTLSCGAEIIRHEGEILNPLHEGMQELELLKEALGSHGFSAQYQQQPLQQEGALLKQDWIARFDTVPDEGQVVQSWDTAIKAGNHNDYSACATWKMVQNEAGKTGFYLLDMHVGKWEFPMLCREVEQVALQWQAEAILVEDKASGQSLLQEMRRKTALPFIAIQPKYDKIQRVASITPLFEAGKVFFPRYASWLAELEAELMGFPNAVHDDRVDAISQFLIWARQREYQQPRVRSI